MQQLALAISPRPEPAFDNFVPGPNAEALARVRQLAAGTLGERIVYLWGEAGSGRSHLLAAAARVNRALVVADDVERLAAAEQHALFVAINEAREGGPAVLAAGDQPPAQLALRADLKSRLAWGLVYQLLPLSDIDKARHLKALADARGLLLSDDVVAYLLTRLPRDMASLQAVMEVLDRYSLMRQRALTLPLVREALAQEMVGGQASTR
ncbi:MAG TPA: DnaA/Hda family protein [Burkholderiales bacterium]|nr:DnaA/Hda family protein [Burkholderiales bacterium]